MTGKWRKKMEKERFLPSQMDENDYIGLPTFSRYLLELSGREKKKLESTRPFQRKTTIVGLLPSSRTFTDDSEKEQEVKRKFTFHPPKTPRDDYSGFSLIFRHHPAPSQTLTDEQRKCEKELGRSENGKELGRSGRIKRSAPELDKMVCPGTTPGRKRKGL